MKYLLLCMACIPAMAYACLNEKHVSKYGKETFDHFSIGDLRLYKNHNIAELELAVTNLLSAKPATEEDILSNKNNLAVNYIKLGKLAQAETILSELLKKHPNDYSVIINLGTLYELQGKNTKALEYIKKALTIDPDSHSGSEWFHVKVLEYKLKNTPEDKIAAQHILGLPGRKEPVSTAYEVIYQLKERIPFTPRPNLVMAKLLAELGDYLADSVSIKAAYVIYEISMDYDPGNVLRSIEKRDALKPYFKKYKEAIPYTGVYYLDAAVNIADNNKIEIAGSLLEKGLNYFTAQEEKRKQEERQKKYLLFGGMGLCALAAGFFLYRRRKQAA